jgi:glycosyltransferase involved in cell wall biosynthesis
MPVIASNIPSHREIAADAALYFPAGDTVELAKILATTLRNDFDRLSYAQASRNRALWLATCEPSWAVALMKLAEL